MTALIIEGRYDAVIDATHPFADVATQNIQLACQNTRRPYYRLLRSQTNFYHQATLVPDYETAVQLLDATVGNILLTVGSKELKTFTKLHQFPEQVFLRILPMTSSIEYALSLGYKNARILAMQGPFSVAFNEALLKMHRISALVTKDSGASGGLEEKLEACANLGVPAIVITRPDEKSGYSLEELLRLFDCAPPPIHSTPMRSPFPLFLNLSEKTVLMVGGGKIASRRIQTLLGAGCNITVIAPECTALIHHLAQTGEVHWRVGVYQSSWVKHFDFICAATNDRNINHQIGKDARAYGKLFNISDCKEESSFWFPAIVDTKDYIVGLVSKNADHRALKETAAKLRSYLNHEEQD